MEKMLMFDNVIDASSDKMLVATFSVKYFDFLTDLEEFMIKEEAKTMTKFILPGRSIKFYDSDDFPLLKRFKTYTKITNKLKDLRAIENDAGVYFILTL